MKRIFNFAYVALAAVMTLVAASCTDSYEYEGATASGEQVYFSNELPSSVELSKSESSITIPVNRVTTAGSITVPLTVVKGAGSFLNYPAEVTFADGSSQATITVTYNPDDVEYGKYVTDSVKIANDEYITPYGSSYYGFSFGATEWANMSANKSVGSYREDMLTTWYGVDNVVYNVTIQESIVNKGMYRLVNPYSENYEYNEDGDYDTDADHYWVIDATDPNFVYFKQYDSEMHWSYGYFHMTSYIQYYLDSGRYTLDQLKSAAPELFGKLENGIITMPERAMLEWMDDYRDGALYYGNTNGKLAVALPGYTIADYGMEATYNGRYTDLNDQDYAEYTLTFGADVATTRSVVVSADDWNSNSETILSGIEDGSIESVESSGSGTVRLPYGETGTYVCVVVIYDAEGNVQGYYVSEEQKLRNSSDAEEKFEDIAAGTFTFGTANVSSILFSKELSLFPEMLGLKSPVTQEAVLSQSQSDPTHFKLTPFWSEGYDLEFYVQEDGSIVVDGVDTGVSNGSENIKVYDLSTASGYNYATAKYYGFASYVDGNTYYFSLGYRVSDGFYSAETETFVVEDTGAKALRAAARIAKASKARHGHQAIKSGWHPQKSFKKNRFFTGNSALRMK